VSVELCLLQGLHAQGLHAQGLHAQGLHAHRPQVRRLLWANAGWPAHLRRPVEADTSRASPIHLELRCHGLLRPALGLRQLLRCSFHDVPLLRPVRLRCPGATDIVLLGFPPHRAQRADSIGCHR
jgi:hypothetical protein